MKHAGRLLAALAVAGLLTASHSAFAAKKSKKAPPKETYLIETTHEESACVALMEAGTKGKKPSAFMAKTEFGCESGDHRGWTTVTAASPEDALKIIPEELRASAKIVMVKKYDSKAKVKAMKKKMMDATKDSGTKDSM